MTKPTFAATTTNISPSPLYDVGIYPEETLKNITGAHKNQISANELAKLKKALAKEGWRVKGKAFYSSGKWLLRFSRLIITVDQVFTGVLMPDMYLDKTTNCVRYRYNNQPVPGMVCNSIN